MYLYNTTLFDYHLVKLVLSNENLIELIMIVFQSRGGPKFSALKFVLPNIINLFSPQKLTNRL